jgi:hypothetical protein
MHTAVKNNLKPAVLNLQARMKNRPPGDNSGTSCDCGDSDCYTIDDSITESGDYTPTEEDNHPNTRGSAAKGMPPAPTRLHRPHPRHHLTPSLAEELTNEQIHHFQNCES